MAVAVITKEGDYLYSNGVCSDTMALETLKTLEKVVGVYKINKLEVSSDGCA